MPRNIGLKLGGAVVTAKPTHAFLHTTSTVEAVVLIVFTLRKPYSATTKGECNYVEYSAYPPTHLLSTCVPDHNLSIVGAKFNVITQSSSMYLSGTTGKIFVPQVQKSEFRKSRFKE